MRAHRGHHRQLLHGALDDQSAIGGGSFCAIEAAPPGARALGATGKPYPITARTRVGLSLEGSPLFHSPYYQFLEDRSHPDLFAGGF